MKLALRIISALFLVASPWVLYWTLSRHDVGVAALTLIGWVIVRTIPILLAAAPQHRATALRLPLIALVFAVLGWALDNGVWLMILPSATQATFGLAFLRSLETTPMIETFARMVKPELAPSECAHCRQWTRVWGIYLLVLAAIGLALAEWASLKTWTAYVGIASYVLVGLLFAVEYIVRKLRFREYGRNPLDWVLARLFPPARSR
ncbi:hypothetical protein BH11MYX1_BH11MYX1_53540 [soil metagenome]